MNNEKTYASVFSLDGVPKFSEALPLALQHVVAMIVGCVTPAMVISNAVDLNGADRVMLVQASLVVSALSTFIQLFPFKKGKVMVGSGLPVIMGVSFAYLFAMQSIAVDFNIATILGAQLVGGIVAIVVGLFINTIRKFFPPLITGTVVFTIGLSLYSTAVNYMAGGNPATNPQYGSWQNWTVAVVTLLIVIICNHFMKGFVKLSSILIGLTGGYILAFFFGMVSFDNVAAAGIIQLPIPGHFGIQFELSSCIAVSLLFAINSIQAIGDFTATTSGSMDRQPTNQELKGGIVAYGITNIIGSVLGCLPTATFSQNVGIVTTTKVINRWILGLAGAIILAAGLFPKFSALLTTIPQCVLGGATISVFASIAMTGIKLVMTEDMNYRNTSIVGLAVALGIGVTQTGALAAFPAWVTTIFGKSPTVIATLVAILLNIVLPRATEKKK